MKFSEQFENQSGKGFGGSAKPKSDRTENPVENPQPGVPAVRTEAAKALARVNQSKADQWAQFAENALVASNAGAEPIAEVVASLLRGEYFDAAVMQKVGEKLATTEMQTIDVQVEAAQFKPPSLPDAELFNRSMAKKLERFGGVDPHAYLLEGEG